MSAFNKRMGSIDATLEFCVRKFAYKFTNILKLTIKKVFFYELLSACTHIQIYKY